jgi:hypothetical protein
MRNFKPRAGKAQVPGCQLGAKAPKLRLPRMANLLICQRRMGGRAVEGIGLENRDHASRAVLPYPLSLGFPPLFEPRAGTISRLVSPRATALGGKSGGICRCATTQGLSAEGSGSKETWGSPVCAFFFFGHS